MHQEELQLIKLCKKGHQKSQIQLYDQYCGAMFNVVSRYIQNDEDAKDVMQEGFIKAFKFIETYQTEATFGAWLKRIIINQCLDELKKKQLKFDEVDVSELKLINENDWDFDSSITKQDIINAIQNLNEKHRIVVKLYLMEGYDHGEISDILDIPIKTSRTHLQRGKLKLQDLLKQKYNETRY